MIPRYSKVIDTLIVLGTYQRKHIFLQSIKSLKSSIKDQNCQLVVVDSSLKPSLSGSDLEDCDYIWAPGEVSMALARNLGYRYGKEKYVFDWICFLEDDLIYSQNWHSDLLARARSLYGKQSPYKLVYGAFSASPSGMHQENKIFDSDNDCYADFFGPVADQRLYKATHYDNVVKHWDPDLMGISSCQTGGQIQRSVMNGFCAAIFPHLNLCSLVPSQESTWVGQRDIGPSAIDKRIKYYRVIQQRAETMVRDSSVERQVSVETELPVQHSVPASAIKYDETSAHYFVKRVVKKLKKILFKR